MAKITKDSILDCVWQLLEKKTPDKITVTEICEDCGINRNTFYYHFTDLIDVLDALLEREHDRFTESEKAKDILTDYNARAPAKTASVCSGRAELVISQSPGTRPSRLSRTQPPTRQAA